MSVVKLSAAAPLALLVAVMSASMSGCATTSAAAATVYLVESGAYGKGIFMVAPAADKSCSVQVKGNKPEPTDLDCSSQYVIGCDIDVASSQPFCQLVREIGTDRESAYPQSKR